MNARPSPLGEGEGWTPAGFWRRYAAWSLDWMLLAPPLALLLSGLVARAWAQALALNGLLQAWVYARVVAADGMVPSPAAMAMALELLRDPKLAAGVQAGSTRLSATLTLLMLALVGAAAAYFIGFEASSWRATPGKRLLRLQVRAVTGGDAGLLRMLLRFFAGGLSWLLLNLGHALAGWRSDRRALHDLIAGTQVLARGPMPRGARYWLLAQAALSLALLLGLLGWLGGLLWQFAQLA